MLRLGDGEVKERQRHRHRENLWEKRWWAKALSVPLRPALSPPSSRLLSEVSGKNFHKLSISFPGAVPQGPSLHPSFGARVRGH